MRNRFVSSVLLRRIGRHAVKRPFSAACSPDHPPQVPIAARIQMREYSATDNNMRKSRPNRRGPAATKIGLGLILWTKLTRATGILHTSPFGTKRCRPPEGLSVRRHLEGPCLFV